jgi:uncharacterized protein YbjT (DUF2867 family)
VRVFVTGGTGAIGGHAVPALVGDGHDVTALARSPEKAARVTVQGATPATVSPFDGDALATAFAGHDAVERATGWSPRHPSAREGLAAMATRPPTA